MKKYIFDESNGLWYEMQGDYYIPCLSVAAEETKPPAFGDSGTYVTLKRNASSCIRNC